MTALLRGTAVAAAATDPHLKLFPAFEDEHVDDLSMAEHHRHKQRAAEVNKPVMSSSARLRGEQLVRKAAHG